MLTGAFFHRVFRQGAVQKRKMDFMVSVCAFLVLLGCDPQMGGVSHQDGGVIAGSVIGGVVGSHLGRSPLMVLGGALLGGYLGGQVGRDMDEMDRIRMARTLEQTPSGRTAHWVDADGKEWVMMPTRTYRDYGRVCRQFRTTVYMGGQPRSAVGRACRTPQGIWKIVN